MAEGEGTMCCPVFGRTLLLTMEEESPFPCRDRLLGGDGLLTAVQIASQGGSLVPITLTLPSVLAAAFPGEPSCTRGFSPFH